MKRRDFFKLSAALGAAWGLRLAFRSAEARAGASYDSGPIYLYIHANGGWDPTMICDPKGTAGINNSYTEAEILTAGNLRYAPTPGNQAFFETYGVHFDPALRDEIVARVDRLKLPSYSGFVQPRLQPVMDAAGQIVDVRISYPQNLEQQMLEYSGKATVSVS